MKALIVHYSLTGHTNRLAEAVKQGASQVESAEVMLMRVAEISTAEVKRGGSEDFKKSFEKIPLIVNLNRIFGEKKFYRRSDEYNCWEGIFL